MRKVPLQRFEYESETGSSLSDEAEALRIEMHKVIRKDRDLHDRVRLSCPTACAPPAIR